MTTERPWLTLLAGCIVTATLGSVHAFSVFLVPFETSFGSSRSSVSLVYSLALVSLTVLVLIGHRIFDVAKPAALASFACMAAAAGLVLASVMNSLAGLYVGYGIIFGAANGIGYGFVLQLVAQAMPTSAGLAMGTVTAVYAVGSIVFAKLYAQLLLDYTPAQTLLVMAGVLAASALLIYVLLSLSRARYHATEGAQTTEDGATHGLVFRLWLGYGTGSAAGLMAIGHATGIVADRGGAAGLMVVGAMTIGAGNALGGVVAGYVADRIAPRLALIMLPAASCAALLVLLVTTGPMVTVILLAAVGFCYGAIIAAYPAAVAAFFGLADAPRIYGRVFTAWGLAGLLAPWMAGVLFDRAQSYATPVIVAAMLGLVSAVLALCMPRER